MTLADKRKELISQLQYQYYEMGKINHILDDYIILCDICDINEFCHFVYTKNAIRVKSYSQKSDKKDSDFSTTECMFYVKNPKFEYLKYSGKKASAA